MSYKGVQSSFERDIKIDLYNLRIRKWRLHHPVQYNYQQRLESLEAAEPKFLSFVF